MLPVLVVMTQLSLFGLNACQTDDSPKDVGALHRGYQ